MAAFCEVGDITTGNLPLPRKLGDAATIKQEYIERAADDIEARLGAVYELPLTPDSGSYEEKLLKRINRYLATGQLVVDIASSAEDNSLHAYGFHHLREANNALAEILAGKIPFGLDKRETDPSDTPGGPMVLNRESSSFVDSFYGTGLRDTQKWGDDPVYPNTGRLF